MFTETGKSGAGTLYISGSNNSDNEYARPMHLYGQEITLFASGGRTSTESENKIAISNTEFYGGTSTNYVQVNSNGFYGVNGINKVEVTPQHFYGGNSNYWVKVNATGIYGGNGGNHINIQSSGSDITTNSSLNVTSVGRYSNNVGNTKIISTPSTVSILTGGATKEATQGIKLSTSDSCYLDMSSGSIELCSLPENSYLRLAKDGGTFLSGLHGDIGLNSGSTSEGRRGVEIVGEDIIYLNSPAVACGNNDTDAKTNFSVKNDIYAGNYYWHWPDGKLAQDATGAYNIWDAITNLVNTYNDHTHTVTVEVPGQSRTETVEIEAVSMSDKLTVGEYDDVGNWQALATGVLQKALKVSKDVTLSIPTQYITVKLNPPDQQFD